MDNVVCGNCGSIIVLEKPGMPRTPCAKCASTSRTFKEFVEDGAHESEHLTGTVLRSGRTIAFIESERTELTRVASLESDGSILLDLRGLPPRNEQDSLDVCTIFVEAMNTKGYGLRLEGRGQGDEDCVVMDGGTRIGIQVVRALIDQDFWSRLSLGGGPSIRRLTVGEAAQVLRAAIDHKAAPAAIPPAHRSKLILVLDAFRVPALALGDVVIEFRSGLGAWASSLGFWAIFVVGPNSDFVARLDQDGSEAEA